MLSITTVFRVDKVRKRLYRDIVVWQFVLNKFDIPFCIRNLMNRNDLLLVATILQNIHPQI